MRALIVATLIGILMTPCFAQAPAGVDISTVAQESQAAANASLATLGKLVTQENARGMGFSGPGDVNRSQLDTPLAGFMLRLASLQEYEQGEDPMSLLNYTGQIVYPVKVSGSVQSSITLRKKGDNWQPVSFGSPSLAKALSGARENVANREMQQGIEFFEVAIPALNVTFVGHVADGKLMLTSVTDIDQIGLKASETRPAEDVFIRLKPEAERHNGLPR